MEKSNGQIIVHHLEIFNNWTLTYAFLDKYCKLWIFLNNYNCTRLFDSVMFFHSIVCQLMQLQSGRVDTKWPPIHTGSFGKGKKKRKGEPLLVPVNFLCSSPWCSTADGLYLISSQSKSLQISRAVLNYAHNALYCNGFVDTSCHTNWVIHVKVLLGSDWHVTPCSWWMGREILFMKQWIEKKIKAQL